MAEDNDYKKFFLHRTVLDTLRSFIDCSDEFLDKVVASGIMSRKEMAGIKSLRWPMSRNQLMQHIVRKNWRKDTFESFNQILLETQGEALTEGIGRIAKEFFKHDAVQVILTEKTPAKGKILAIDITQAKKPVMIDDNDEERKDNDKAIIHQLTAESTVLRHRLEHADRLVTQTLVEIHHDVAHDQLESGLLDLRQILTKQSVELIALRKQNVQLYAAVKDVRAKMTVLTDENIELKGINSSLEETSEKEKEEKASEIQVLQELNGEHSKKIDHMEKKTQRSEKKMRNQIHEMKSKIVSLTMELASEKSAVEVVRKERDKASDELVRISEGTRKLLQKLDMGNDYDNIKMSLAVDHARNSVYSRARRTSLAPVREPVAYRMATERRNSTPVVPSGDSSILAHLKIANSVTEEEEEEPAIPEDSLKHVADANQATAPELDDESMMRISKCTVCRKIFALNSNFDGACLSHVDGAVKLNEGTAVEVWSCCKSIDTIRGCQKVRHIAELVY